MNDDSISRHAAIDTAEWVYRACEGNFLYYHDLLVAALMDLPTVDAVQVAHSEWIPKEKADTPYGLEMECANCGFSVIVNDALYFKFCPNCGALMDGNDGDHHD